MDAVPDQALDAKTTEGRGSPRPGHIGLIVLGSVAFGFILGIVLDVLVFGGNREPVITGLALLSLAAGCLLLAELSKRRTDQPQQWARIAALAFAVTGVLVLLLRPSGHLLRLLGWVWPVLLLVIVIWMIRESRRSLHNWSRRAVLYPAFGVLGLVALGGAIETVIEATTKTDPPPGGHTYLVAGHKLYMRCTGAGSPTVVLFNGLGERTPSWAWVQGDVARQTRVCAFDRAGEGWSGAGVGGQDAHQLSSDAHGLLKAANVPGPYVVAGHSVGGLYALAYAMDYPADVSGVALLDSSTPYQFDLPSYPKFYWALRRLSGLMPPLARTGVVRAYIGLAGSSLPAGAASNSEDFASSPRELNADRLELAELRTVMNQTKALTSLDGKPLYVLSADVGQQSGWAAAQDRLARLSTNSVHTTTHGATHQALMEEQRYAAQSAQAIDAVVQAIRNGTPIAGSP